MKKRALGRTGLEVGELSLGTAFITRGEQGFEGSLPVVRGALEAGINLFDTSADYGDSEQGLGWALNELGNPDCILSTKLGPRNDGRPFDPQNPSHLRRTVQESLRFLNREVIDILMIHEPDRPGQLDWYTDWESLRGPVVDLLAELKKEGLIRFTGLGGTTVHELTRLVDSGDYDVVLTAFNTSPLWREALDTVIPAARKHNMGVLAASPTQQGWLAARYDQEVRHGALWLSPPRRAQLLALYELAEQAAIELPVLCLRWALGLPGVSTVLTGPRNTAQLAQNLQALEQGPLPPDVAARLDEIAAMLPHRPFEEPSGCKLGNPRYKGPGHVVY